jgi:hypothetical protein
VTDPARLPRGSQCSWALLTEDMVRAICSDLASGSSQTALALRYGVTVSTINTIAKGKRWQHIDVPRRATCAFCGAPDTVTGAGINPYCSLECRFWSRVNKGGPTPAHVAGLGPCWVWTGDCYKSGYGRFRVPQALGQPRQCYASRVSWFLTHGRWPNPFACHHCDNPPCVNPAHLFEGDAAANAADMVAKGRHGGRSRKGFR